jgi:hypothetical protein
LFWRFNCGNGKPSNNDSRLSFILKSKLIFDSQGDNISSWFAVRPRFDLLSRCSTITKFPLVSQIVSVWVRTATCVENDFLSNLVGSVVNFNGSFGSLVVTILPSLVDDAANCVCSSRCPYTKFERELLEIPNGISGWSVDQCIKLACSIKLGYPCMDQT